MTRPRSRRSQIRVAAFIAAGFACAALLAPIAQPSSKILLKKREHRQVLTLHADRCTVRFFRRHRWLLHGRSRPVAVRALRFARAEIAWTMRELAKTRAQLRPAPNRALYAAQASWYGPGLYGNSTACGGRLATSTVGVAHKTLACGTRLLICYLGRCARATVVDRGPYVAGREFDLTGALAWRLGFNGVGTVTWRVL